MGSMEECRLRASNGVRGMPCDGDSCVFWRVVGQLDLIEGAAEDGCAVQRFELLGDRGGEVSRWLLSVKERVEYEADGRWAIQDPTASRHPDGLN